MSLAGQPARPAPAAPVDPEEERPGSPPSRVRVWTLAVRPRTLGASLVPVLVGTAAAWAAGSWPGRVTLVCLGAALLLQVGTNLANDALDFARGIDTQERIGPTRVTQAGMLGYREVVRGASVAFGLALLCGIYLVGIGGAPILWIGVISIAAGVGYSGGPFPLSSHGLGELAAFVFFGVVAVTGTTWLHTLDVSELALMASIPVGALVSCIMLVNNLRDIDSDAKAGKRTLAVRIGPTRTRGLYVALIALAYLATAAVAADTGSAGPLLVALSVPLALRAIRGVQGARSGAEFNALLARTAALHGVFGLLLAAGIVL